jgi:hypothetical protein
MKRVVGIVLQHAPRRLHYDGFPQYPLSPVPLPILPSPFGMFTTPIWTDIWIWTGTSREAGS